MGYALIRSSGSYVTDYKTDYSDSVQSSYKETFSGMTKRRDFQRLLQTRLRPSWEYCTSVATGGKKNLVSLDLKEIYDHKHKETWEFFASVKLKQNPSYVH